MIKTMQNAFKTAAALAAFFYVHGSTPASAQCGGLIPSGTVCGNSGATSLLPKPNAPSAFGFLTAAVRTVTVNATIASSDCGKTIQAGTGSTGLFTLTLPTVAGFPTNCVIGIKNGDTARGKSLSGFPAGFGASSVLWPNQYGTVQIIGGAWVTGVNPGIYQAAAGVTLNVNHVTGSDAATNDCLGTGTGACATIYHAFQLFQTVVKSGGAGTQSTVQSDCGFTENPPGAFLGPSATGNGVIFFIGNEADPRNCQWLTSGLHVDDGAVISMRGFLTANSGSGQTWLAVEKGGVTVYANMMFGPATAGAHFAIYEGATLAFDGGTYQVGINSGGCAPTCFNYHIYNAGGTLELTGATVSVPQVMTCSAWYIGVGTGSRWNAGANSFTGAGGAGGTCQQYNLSEGAQLRLNGVTALPGGTLGTVSSGACLDGVCVNVGRPNLFVNLPTCNSIITGAQYSITDSNTAVWGAVAAGGGANNVSVQCNGVGAQWKVYALN